MMGLSFKLLPVVIVCMLALAGVKIIGLVETVRIGTQAHASPVAHAEKPEPTGAKAQPAKVPGKSEVTPSSSDATAAPLAEPPISAAERAALQDLRERRIQLDARAAKLDERDAILSATEQRLTDRIQQMTILQTKLEQLDKERRDREEANWTGLVKTYEAMRPRDAAAIFNELDNTLVVQVLDRMKERNAAAVLAAMLPDRARTATVQLAQWRNRVDAAPHLDTVAGEKK